MKSTAVYFTAPGRVELREQPLIAPGPDELLVETEFSAISAGTEMLVYRGQFPRDLADANDKLSGDLHYPLCYGYASVGRVSALGSQVDKSWADRLVFSFHPHQSHFLATADSLLPIPESLSPENAVFLPNMETAVNFVQDAAPLLGECVLVLGQGIVGLLTASLLHEFPQRLLVTADRYQLRRNASLAIGVSASLDPTFPDFRSVALQSLPYSLDGFDLTLELSGNPSALDDAIALTMFSGRILIGSWYGEKRAPVDLGGKFHRSRIELISSQVSSIAPNLSGRWNKSRRFDVAWQALMRFQPQKLITHHFKLEQAAEAYQLLDQSPEIAIQVVLDYS
jgi:2-desacetyl-2-hydroxyethyl bacteriochlorophyllide A dehydrogenase